MHCCFAWWCRQPKYFTVSSIYHHSASEWQKNWLGVSRDHSADKEDMSFYVTWKVRRGLRQIRGLFSRIVRFMPFIIINHNATSSRICSYLITLYLLCIQDTHYDIEPMFMLTHRGRDNLAAISQTTFSNAFSWMKMNEFLLRFHCSLFPRVKWTKFDHWFR